MSSEYELYYFDIRALAEPIRYIFFLKGIDFVDHRLPLHSIPAVTPPEMSELCPFGQMPILKVGEEFLSNSQVIGRYLAQKFELTGKTEWDAIRCDELVAGAFDMIQWWTAGIVYSQSDDHKASIEKIANDKAQQRYLPAFNKILQEKESGDEPLFLVGDSITWADITLAHYLDTIQKAFKSDFLEDFPVLEKFIENIFETPGIKEYIQQRADTIF